jgi:hypothetical protein
MVEQIERVRKRVPRTHAANGSAQPVEIRHSVLATDHLSPSSVTDLTRSLCDERYTVSPVISALGKLADPVAWRRQMNRKPSCLIS